MRSLRRILYVEDDEDIRQIAQMALEEVGGYELGMCESGQQALDTVDAFEPDLILLDVMMPDMDGIETLQRLRERGAVDNVPVIMMTAKVHPEEMARYRESGVFDVIPKPFDAMTLSDDIARIWDRFHG
ncbi:response regulator receiver domain-containing protein [Tamilnaduibacter salinus]|uniref:Response regulator receiver domain-containing protein n=1 Tax=Tamilnaduibacter salinus TaxID=1484056 RepID=A0A2U1CTV7_9GAMM|nr:response regulator [Tamilnaduibacter salinus]PVY70055.1 response regulator receiver domain-containing protein [Tamilnaduibacter salinus]